MCEALRELFQDELDERERIGKQIGEQKICIQLIHEGILTIQDVAKRLQMSEDAVRSML